MIDGLLEIFIKKVFIVFESVSKKWNYRFYFWNFCASDRVSIIVNFECERHILESRISRRTPLFQSSVKEWNIWRCFSRCGRHWTNNTTRGSCGRSNHGTRGWPPCYSHNGTWRWYVRLSFWFYANDFGSFTPCYENGGVKYDETWCKWHFWHMNLSQSVFVDGTLIE